MITATENFPRKSFNQNVFQLTQTRSSWNWNSRCSSAITGEGNCEDDCATLARDILIWLINYAREVTFTKQRNFQSFRFSISPSLMNSNDKASRAQNKLFRPVWRMRFTLRLLRLFHFVERFSFARLCNLKSLATMRMRAQYLCVVSKKGDILASICKFRSRRHHKKCVTLSNAVYCAED